MKHQFIVELDGTALSLREAQQVIRDALLGVPTSGEAISIKNLANAIGKPEDLHKLVRSTL